MSKMGDKLAKKVSMTLTVEDWIMVQEAMIRYDMGVAPDRLLDVYLESQRRILKETEKLLDEHFPIV